MKATIHEQYARRSAVLPVAVVRTAVTIVSPRLAARRRLLRQMSRPCRKPTPASSRWSLGAAADLESVGHQELRAPGERCNARDRDLQTAGQTFEAVRPGVDA